MTTTSLRQVGEVLVLLADQVAQDALLDVVDVLDALGRGSGRSSARNLLA